MDHGGPAVFSSLLPTPPLTPRRVNEESSFGECFPLRKAKLADQAVISHLIIPICSQQQSVTQTEKVRCLFEQDCVYIQISKLRRHSDPPKTQVNTRFSHPFCSSDTKCFLISFSLSVITDYECLRGPPLLCLQGQRLWTKWEQRLWGNENLKTNLLPLASAISVLTIFFLAPL